MEDNEWKEEFEKMGGSPQDFMIETKVIAVHIAIGMVIALLKKQRESMKRKAIQCVPEKKIVGHINKCNMCSPKCGFNDCRDQALSALREI